MNITNHLTRFTIPKIWANIPTFYRDPSSDTDPGYVVAVRMLRERGEPEPATQPGELFDYKRMTPIQRAAFDDWFIRTWGYPPPLTAFFDQIIHGLEVDLLLNLEPSPESVPLLCYMLKNYRAGLVERQQLNRVVSLLHWQSLGYQPDESLKVTSSGPWLNAGQINSSLSALCKHSRSLPARLAHRLCLELDRHRTGIIPSDDEFGVKEAFVQKFNARWPQGIMLTAPTTTIPIVHHPGHPDTAAQVAKEFKVLALESWDFLSEPRQFHELLALWDDWKAMPTLHVAAKLTDPALRQLAAVPSDSLAATVKSRIHEAAARFLKSDGIAMTRESGENSGFDFGVTLDPNGLSFGEDEIAVRFKFVISEVSGEGSSNECPVTGSAVAAFGIAAEVTFEDIDVDNLGRHLGVEDDDES